MSKCSSDIDCPSGLPVHSVWSSVWSLQHPSTCSFSHCIIMGYPPLRIQSCSMSQMLTYHFQVCTIDDDRAQSQSFLSLGNSGKSYKPVTEGAFLSWRSNNTISTFYQHTLESLLSNRKHSRVTKLGNPISEPSECSLFRFHLRGERLR